MRTDICNYCCYGLYLRKFMDNHCNNFVTIFYKLLFDFNRYWPSDTVQNILDSYKDLDMAKVIFHIHSLLQKHTGAIEKKEDTMFVQPFILLPGINLSEAWPKLLRGQKNKIFTYLKILEIESDIIMNRSNASASSRKNV